MRGGGGSAWSFIAVFAVFFLPIAALYVRETAKLILQGEFREAGRLWWPILRRIAIIAGGFFI
jgi:hypothetical protein